MTTSGVSSTQTAAAKVAAAKAAAAKAAAAKAAAATPNPNAAQLPLLGTNLGAPGVVSPYDGSTPLGAGAGLGGYPVEAGTMPGSLGGLDAGRPQTNATNQSALATNGNINQDVKNENSYHNTYLNIIAQPYGYGGVMNQASLGWGAGSYGWNGMGTPYTVDPATGQVYVQKKDGIIGWFQRLFRGY